MTTSPASRIKSKQQHMYRARPWESLDSNAAQLSSFRTSIQSGILQDQNSQHVVKKLLVLPYRHYVDSLLTLKSCQFLF